MPAEDAKQGQYPHIGKQPRRGRADFVCKAGQYGVDVAGKRGIGRLARSSVVLTAFLAIAGLSYVYLTLQLYHLGERRKAVENELATLRTQNDIASAQTAALTSRSALQRRLKEGYLKMVPISEANIVRLTMPASSADDEAIQPVVNPSSKK